MSFSLPVMKEVILNLSSIKQLDSFIGLRPLAYNIFKKNYL